MTRQMPVVEMRVRDMGEQLVSMVALHKGEIEESIKQGIERAASGISDAIVEQACNAAQECFHKEVESYFSWGPGRDAIKAAVAHALSPMAAAMRGKK